MQNSATILVVDDERNACSGLAILLQDEGYQVVTAFDGREGLERVRDSSPDMVLTDMKMPEIDGLQFLQSAKNDFPELPVVVMTAYGTVETAVEAMKAGAFDYLLKPINFEELLLTVQRVLSYQELWEENVHLKSALADRASVENIIGNSPAMQSLFKQMAQVAETDVTTLLVGETGTGKELVAQAIHQGSKRKDKPLVIVNCAALSESILESELFGHEKGAFTGADRRREGRFQRANLGTIFLDEVTEVPEKVQLKLLRFLENGEIEKVGWWDRHSCLSATLAPRDSISG